MMSYVNPFNEVFETRMFRNTRTLRTGFGRKLADTFYAFSGSFFDKNNKNHIGFFDYATLQILYYLAKLFALSYQRAGEEPWAIMLIIPLFIINIPLLALRYGSAAILTLALSPIVLFIHAISQISGSQLKKEVNALAINLNPQDSSIKDVEKLGDFLKKYKKTLGEISVDCKGTYNKLTLEFHNKLTGPSSSSMCECCAYGGEEKKHVIFSAELDLTKEEDNGVFKSMIRLNAANLTRKLEKRSYLFDLYRDDTAISVKNSNIDTYDKTPVRGAVILNRNYS
jgi:hypothetical protein